MFGIGKVTLSGTRHVAGRKIDGNSDVGSPGKHTPHEFADDPLIHLYVWERGGCVGRFREVVLTKWGRSWCALVKAVRGEHLLYVVLIADLKRGLAVGKDGAGDENPQVRADGTVLSHFEGRMKFLLDGGHDVVVWGGDDVIVDVNNDKYSVGENGIRIRILGHR